MTGEIQDRRADGEQACRTNAPVAPSRSDFDRVRLAVNRWRADNAPFLTRDEAVLLMLGQWLAREGYLQPEAGESPAANDARPVTGPAAVTTLRGRADEFDRLADQPQAARRLGDVRESSAIARAPRRPLPSFRVGIAR